MSAPATPPTPPTEEEQKALVAAATAAGEKVRELKASGAAKDAVDAAVAELMAAKQKAGLLDDKKKKKGKKDKKKGGGGGPGKPKKEKKVDPRWTKQVQKKTAEKIAWVNDTPAGEKKALKEMTKENHLDSYHPNVVEAAWQEWWEAKGFYSADAAATKARADPDEKFVMVIPPPNVTGTLHLGHAIMATLEDVLTRWNRMEGKATLWLPGTDHAGIATQTVVEKQLMRLEGKTRHDLGREPFLKRVWEWKEKNGGHICKQLRRLACSVDWEREVFTMDPKLSRAVTEAFVRMHDSGKIYRDNRLVNWSCRLKSAISDIEVDYVELEKRTLLKVPGYDQKVEFGVIVSFAYPVEGGGEVVVATTRIETMLGDSAVAIHPEDPRYTHLHGKHAIHPFSGRKIPFVLDAELVDMSFGTGCVKITPAHDPNDYECGKRHGLQFISILTDDGLCNDECGEFEGMPRYECRAKIMEALDAKGLLRGKEDNAMRLALCSRSKDVIEPRIKPQWWVSCAEMAERSVRALREGELEIKPEFHHSTWYNWLENIRDWCISRQLWWGHRVPAYQVAVKGRKMDRVAGENPWVVARDADEARAKAAARFECDPADVELSQDEDVLDTWFSSGLFPFSVFGWPDQTEDLEAFYPTSLLETGHDILFFWVARMVMMGLELTGKLPFKTVYLHAMVRDAHGRKMSKSLGNVIDPLWVMDGCTLEDLNASLMTGNLAADEVELAKKGQRADFPSGIPECGTDALRFGLCAYTAQGRDVNLSVNRVVGWRNFCNKLWNATRFAMQYIAPDLAPAAEGATAPTSARNAWILSRLSACAAACGERFRAYAFAELTAALHGFFLYELCDVYLEAVKPVFREAAAEGASAAALEAGRETQQVLYECLTSGLRLLHPFMPFVTEELWQRLPRRADDPESIMLARYPRPNAARADAGAESAMAAAQAAAGGLRALCANVGLTAKKDPEGFVLPSNAEGAATMAAMLPDVIALSRVSSVRVLEVGASPPEGCGVQIVGAAKDMRVYVLYRGKVDFAEQIKKASKARGKAEGALAALAKKRDAPAYAKVPESVREADAEKARTLGEEKSALDTLIAEFEKLAAE